MKKIILLITFTISFLTTQLSFSESIILADSLNITFNEKLNLGSNINIRDIDCFEEKKCLLTVNYGNLGSCLILTTDGGKTWEHILSDEFSKSYGKDSNKINRDYLLFQSCYLKNNTIISVDAYVRNFFKSSDHGQTWDTIPGSINDTLVFIDKFNMINENYGYFSTMRHGFSNDYIRALYITEDGCKSWKRINFEMNFYNKEQFNPVFLHAKVIGNKAFIFFRLMYKSNPIQYNTIIVTIDLITQEQNTIETPQYTNDFYFISENEGIAIGSMLEPIKFDVDTATIQKTFDGGKTWELVYKGDQNFKEASYLNYYSQNMIVVTGRGNRLLISRDRGENWEDVADTNDISIQKYPLSIASEEAMYYLSYRKLYKWVDGETSVVELPKMYDLRIYPNPVQDQLRIENYEIGLNQNIEIYNILSEKVLTANISENNSINVSNLTPGIYFIKIGDSMQKFVKQ